MIITVTSHHISRHFEEYLDEHSGAVERVPATTEALVEGAGMRRGGGAQYGSGSDLSSEASYNEQYERRVTTDYKKSQTTKTTGAVNTTAEFHVFPPQKMVTGMQQASQVYKEKVVKLF